MAAPARVTDYRIGGSATRLANGQPPREVPARGAAAAGAPAIDEFLQALARSVQQFHTYPPDSPLCQSAIGASARALVLLERDQVGFRVAPRDLIVEEAPVGRGTIIEHELARRFHAASIAQVSIDRAVSPRELSHLCLDLVRCSTHANGGPGLIDVLAEHGVDRIVLRPAFRPEVLAVGAPPETVSALIDIERRRREELFARGGAVSHLYPPDRGWVRLDPSNPTSSVSLNELALLADDPAALASMLMRLTDDGTSDGAADSLMRKFSDVAMLFSTLEPRIARIMFSRLARAVLDLAPDSRQALLRRTILPGLLDGRVDGAVLRDFPDLELADSLCLLLDLETASPEVVIAALGRLDLPAERQTTVAPLVERRLGARGNAKQPTGLDAHARRLVAIDARQARSFAEYSAFDLSLDGETSGELPRIRDRILSGDALTARLACLWQLTRLEPNPESVQRFVNRAAPLLDRLDRDRRHETLASCLARFRGTADALREGRPDVACVIDGMLAALSTTERAGRLSDLAAMGGNARAAADQIVRALSPAIGPALFAVAQAHPADARDARGRTAAQLLCDHAMCVAPALAPLAPGAAPPAQRLLARVFGLSGPGFEAVLGEWLASPDEQTVREVLRALARIGSPTAAALVSGQVEKAIDWVSGAAEESLWRFPASEAQRQAAALLRRRGFVLSRPQAALRLMERAAQAGATVLTPVLPPLMSLRFRLWSPALARVGRRARALVRNGGRAPAASLAVRP